MADHNRTLAFTYIKVHNHHHLTFTSEYARLVVYEWVFETYMSLWCNIEATSEIRIGDRLLGSSDVTKDRKNIDYNGEQKNYSAKNHRGGNSRFVASTLVGRELLGIWKARDRRNSHVPRMTPLRVVNLTYITHGIYMAFYGGAHLISEEAKAWDHGPIFQELFDATLGNVSKKWYVKSIPRSQNEMNAKDVKLNPEEIQMIEVVYEAHKFLDDSNLLSLTVSDGTPWDDTRKRMPNSTNNNISNDLIYKFYREVKEAVLK